MIACFSSITEQIKNRSEFLENQFLENHHSKNDYKIEVISFEHKSDAMFFVNFYPDLI